MTGIYDEVLGDILAQNFDWRVADLKAVLMPASYGFDAGHLVADIREHRCGESLPLTGLTIDGKAVHARPTYVLATKEVRCDRVVVMTAGGLLVACVPIAPIVPVRGQRVDVQWSPQGIFTL